MKKGIGKKVTLALKLAGVLFAAGAYIFESVFATRPLTVDESFAIISIGAFVVSAGLPIDLSMIVKNIRGEK